ncbi:MAG: DUF5110 domain-containing protein [Phocaeicola vulgatus]
MTWRFVRLHPGANATFILYEDENDNYNYEKGSLFYYHFPLG